MKKINNVNIKQCSFDEAPKGEFETFGMNIVFDPDADGYLSLALLQRYLSIATHPIIMERGEHIVVPDDVMVTFLDCHPARENMEDTMVIDHHAPYEHEQCTAVQVVERFQLDKTAQRLAQLVQVRDLMQTPEQVGEQLHLEGMALNHYLFNSEDKIQSAEVGSARWWDYMVRLSEWDLEDFIEGIIHPYEAHLKEVDDYAERMVIEGESFTHQLIEGKGLLVEHSPLMYECMRDILSRTSHDYLVMTREVPAGILHICRSVGDCDLRPCAEAHGSGGHKNAASFVVPSE